VQHVRAGFDAILVGAETALADDPLLTVRGRTVPRVAPIRVVADASLRLPAASRLLRTIGEAPVWLLAAEDAPNDREIALMEKGARILRVPRGERGLDIAAALDALWREGVRTVLCEGGGRLGAALLGADRVARLVLFVAPMLLGADAVPAFPAVAGGASSDPARWRLAGSAALGRDVLAVWDRAYDPVR
jgi:diaminohydroxyphosphoribosylaminopyrimidine deaminase/5-amino-6-(5-phosphoribosylamino)uracil reductase